MQGDAQASLRKMIDAAADTASSPSGPRAEWVDRVQHLVSSWRDDVAPRATSEELHMRP